MSLNKIPTFQEVKDWANSNFNEYLDSDAIDAILSKANNDELIYRDGSGNLTGTGRTWTASDTAPSSPSKGDGWIDTTFDPPTVKIYDGTNWLSTMPGIPSGELGNVTQYINGFTVTGSGVFYGALHTGDYSGGSLTVTADGNSKTFNNQDYYDENVGNDVTKNHLPAIEFKDSFELSVNQGGNNSVTISYVYER